MSIAREAYLDFLHASCVSFPNGVIPGNGSEVTGTFAYTTTPGDFSDPTASSTTWRSWLFIKQQFHFLDECCTPTRF